MIRFLIAAAVLLVLVAACGGPLSPIATPVTVVATTMPEPTAVTTPTPQPTATVVPEPTVTVVPRPTHPPTPTSTYRPRPEWEIAAIATAQAEQRERALIPTPPPRDGEDSITVGCTGSMEPVLTCNDRVRVLYDPPPTEIKAGDIIIFTVPSGCRDTWLNASLQERHIIHRVTRVTTLVRRYSTGKLIEKLRAYETKGDANLIVDPCLIPYRSVVAVVRDSRLS